MSKSASTSEITDDKVMDVDNVEQFAHDFYFNFLLIHNL